MSPDEIPGEDPGEEIQWEEPPAHVLARKSRGAYAEFASALRRNPGKWAVLPGSDRTPKGADGTAANIRRGAAADFKPPRAFDARADPDTAKVYVKYRGPSEPIPAPDPREPREPSNAPAIRAWARENGYDIPAKGRLPAEVIERYLREGGGRSEDH